MFKDISISKRLIFGFGLLIVFLFATNLMALKHMAGIMEDMNKLVDDRMIKVNDANKAMEIALANGRALRGLLLVDTAEERKKIEDEVAQLRKSNTELLGKLESQLHSDQGKALMATIKERRHALHELYPSFFSTAEKSLSEAKSI